MPNITIRTIATMFAVFLVALMTISCSGTRPTNLGIHNSVLANCPSTPNCVSSDSEDKKHTIAGYRLKASSKEAWEATKALVLKIPRATIIKETEDYLHAECRSAVFGFVDDLELHLREGENLIAVRSAARLGYSDFGVNRQRIEDLRASLIELKMISAVE
jgi:uncharacterized protein (DUF1499 family)